MASTLSNLYVEKASSEHPLALWMLNEQVDYVSQITEAERQFELFAKWDIVNAEAEPRSSSELNAPFLDSATSVIEGFLPPTETQDIVLTSKFLLPTTLVQNLFNFNIGFYIYLQTALANTISVGYKYTNIETNETVEVLSTKNVVASDRARWIFVSETFDLPPNSSIAEDVKIVIKVNVSQGATAGGYDFYINGLSLGQLSEDSNKLSLGITPDPMPLNIALPSQLKSLPAFPYGASGENAYYVAQENQLFSKNFGVPLVFGSSNITKISPNILNGVNHPSLIFPGYGFLNKRGRYNEYTIEMWIRIDAQTNSPRRIFGPIASLDGLYVDGAFLTLRIGNSVGSHFVGDWFRPMLVHIRIVDGSAILVLNGEEVVALEINQQFLDLPDEFVNSKSQDWLGFYAYEDIDPIDIDTFSIYSYSIPTQIIKRRWVWGQAVTAPEQTNSSINSITAFNDYAFANYTANYNYPDFANWKQAYFSNVNAESKVLSLPDYALPDFRLGERNSEELFEDIKLILPSESDPDDVSGKKYITLFPNLTWDSDSDHIYFQSFGTLNEPVETVYGVFKTDGTEENKPLIKITNKINNNSISIYINNSTVTYQKTINNTTSTIATTTIIPDKKFAVGLDIKKIVKSQDSEINRFFTDQPSLDMYVAGDGVTKFNGKIYKVGFNAAYNSRKIFWMYDDEGILNSSIDYEIIDAVAENGKVTFTTSEIHNYLVGDVVSVLDTVSDPENEFDFVDKEIVSITDDSFTVVASVSAEYTSGGIVTDNANILHNHTANYTLTTIDKYGLFFPDIAVSGYWEDYQPLSYFSKAITDFDLEQNYELDMIQYNQDFPQPPASAASLEVSTWEYGDLQIAYSVPEILTYADLNNQFYTGWENYLEMSQNSVRTNFYETRESSLRSYISFQPIASGANRSLSDFHSFAKPLVSGILDPAAFNLDWQQTAFETTSGTIIYPPTKTATTNKNINFEDYALVYHLDFKSEGILHQPIRFKELQLASKVLERTDFTSVGSRFGIPVYYYTRRGLYFDLKGKNPIATYKKSTPYLYLDRESGWKIKGEFDVLTDRGLAIPVNLSRAEKTEVSSVQMWIRFSERDFPLDPVMVFSIDHNNGTYDFFIQADSSKNRGFIFAVNRATSEIINDIGYYLNGQSVFKPFLVKEEWAVLGLEFNELLDFSLRTGLINLNGPLTYNNISYNLATNIEKSESLETRLWSTLPETWGGLLDELDVTDGSVPPYRWQQVYIISQSKTFIVDPKAIYEKYTGSNRSIVDDNSSGILVDPDRIRVFKDISWSEKLKVPV